MYTTRLYIASLLALCLACSGPSQKQNTPEQAATKTIAAKSVNLVPATAEEILHAIKNANTNVVLVNAWATFCIPCREEFPDMMRLYDTYKDRGLKLVLVSGDFEDQAPKARQFLAKQGVDFVSYIKKGKDMAFINGLDPRWSGALPATWVYDAKGQVHHFWEGKATYEMFEQKVLDVLNNTANPPSRDPS
ncbi:MAG: TlpA disulfide reductase family protein [bacterium]|nr:TlpA disulfide reductase family protein [bacterium]